MTRPELLTSTKFIGKERVREELIVGTYTLSPNPSTVTKMTQINVQINNIKILSQPTYPSSQFGDWSYFEESLETTPPCENAIGFLKHANGPWNPVPGTERRYTQIQFFTGGGGTANVTFSFDVSYQVAGILDYGNLPNLKTFNQVGIQQQGSVTVDKEIVTERVEKMWRCYEGGVLCY